MVKHNATRLWDRRCCCCCEQFNKLIAIQVKYLRSKKCVDCSSPSNCSDEINNDLFTYLLDMINSNNLISTCSWDLCTCINKNYLIH